MNKHKLPRKLWVLDTNILLSDSYLDLLKNFTMDTDSAFFIPTFVIKELDSFKKEHSDRGRKSRKVTRELFNLASMTSFEDGVLQFALVENPNYKFLLKDENSRYYDYELEAFKHVVGVLQKDFTVEIITQDINLALSLRLLNIDVKLLTSSSLIKKYATSDSFYLGREKLYLPVDKIYKNEKEWAIDLADIDLDHPLAQNAYIEIYIKDTGDFSGVLGKVRGNQIVPLTDMALSEKPFGLKPRNNGQRFMVDALSSFHSDIPLVIFKGPAGTAKTLFSLAAALYYTQKDQMYENILFCRPGATNGESIGFLPGSEKEKLEPYTRALKDALKIILSSNRKSKNFSTDQNTEIERYFNEGIINVESLIYQRGRSLHNTFIILDEMQNSSINQIKCLSTRIGIGSKMVVIGDPSENQIDDPRLNTLNNGLSKLSDMMVGSKLTAQLTLREDESERSPITKDILSRF